jgi:hypothetical protein
MKIRNFLLGSVGLASVGLGIWVAPAQAVNLSVAPSSIYQFGNGSGVYVGHTVMASTSMNGLEAGGTFRAHCMSPDTGDIPGSRSLPSSGLIGPRQLYVTIPAQLPALRNMPGWAAVPRGSRLMCDYDWTAYAKESAITLGVPGISTIIGGQHITDSGRITFWMKKPGTSTGDDDACIP